MHRQTLLRKDDRVKEYEHEFWSLRAYIVPLDAIVTNSGRVLTLNVGEITNGANGEQVEIALLIVRDYNGDQTISLNLLTERLLGTYDLAEKADMRGFTVAYDEPESEAHFEGAVVRRYARESYTWVLPDRDPIKLYLGEIGPGVGYTLFWDRS